MAASANRKESKIGKRPDFIRKWEKEKWKCQGFAQTAAVCGNRNQLIEEALRISIGLDRKNWRRPRWEAEAIQNFCNGARRNDSAQNSQAAAASATNATVVVGL
jgi:hypothetical protein